MNYVVGTCGWVEWLTDGFLSAKFYNYLKKTEQLFIPTIIQYELYKWANKNRDEKTAIEIIGMTESCQVISLDTRLALLASEISCNFKLAMADAIVYASSEQYNANLITCDKHFANLPNVTYFEKNN